MVRKGGDVVFFLSFDFYMCVWCYKPVSSVSVAAAGIQKQFFCLLPSVLSYAKVLPTLTHYLLHLYHTEIIKLFLVGDYYDKNTVLF